eukprot:GGOE01022247.1.p1 GENE.GGOE01022247.1~~GGOE01022247.1.p1  ORF type:complete len:188 (+),score=47.65 GGOE01022247.1:28-564(+)
MDDDGHKPHRAPPTSLAEGVPVPVYGVPLCTHPEFSQDWDLDPMRSLGIVAAGIPVQQPPLFHSRAPLPDNPEHKGSPTVSDPLYNNIAQSDDHDFYVSLAILILSMVCFLPLLLVNVVFWSSANKKARLLARLPIYLCCVLVVLVLLVAIITTFSCSHLLAEGTSSTQVHPGGHPFP